MRVAEIDRGFVRAAPDRVFELLRDPARYPEWWPRVRPAGEGALRFPELGPVGFSVEGVREGVKVVVTGAAGGIGNAVCERLVEDGYRIAALDLNEGDASRVPVTMHQDREERLRKRELTRTARVVRTVPFL